MVGSFHCYAKQRGSPLQVCRLLCPQSMKPRPFKVQYRCHKGRWSLVGQNTAHCVAKQSVALVEQQSASPQLLNNLMSSYLNLSNHYLPMAYFFDRADVQLPGFHRYFLHLWQRTQDQARTIMAYVNRRGGWIDMTDLPRPGITELLHLGQESGHVGLVAMETAVTMERESHSHILYLLELLEKPKNHDPHMMHTVENTYMADKVKIIKELTDYITQLRAFQQSGEDDYRLGEYELDSVLQ
ncbi:hypothetical protein ACOMHN_035976 [Nucella lapillus]